MLTTSARNWGIGLVRGLPSDMPAAVFVVLHIGRSSQLAEISGEPDRFPQPKRRR